MKLEFIQATPDKAEIIGSLVVQLTQEICERTDAHHFNIDLAGTVQRCEELLPVQYPDREALFLLNLRHLHTPSASLESKPVRLQCRLPGRCQSV